jgi:hypothetical protein
VADGAGDDVPTDGVSDARSPSELDDPETGEPWGDPEIGAVDLIPGRDYDPEDDPEAED